MLTIPAEIHHAVTMLTKEERNNHALVSETVRSADKYAVPRVV
jgi:hypothetical protein